MKCFYLRVNFKSKQSSNNHKKPDFAPQPGGGDRPTEGINGKTSCMRSLMSPRRGIAELYRERREQSGLREFSFQELRDATRGFHWALKIGEGGFGSVYKGTIKDVGDGDGKPPLVVAIKRLNQHGL